MAYAEDLTEKDIEFIELRKKFLQVREERDALIRVLYMVGGKLGN